MNEVKERIISLLTSTNRVPATFFNYLEEIGFWTSACSGSNHLAIEGGLALHSLNVYDVADKDATTKLPFEEYCEISDSIIISALLHDLGKAGQFGKPGYIPNILKSGKQSAAKPFAVNPELLYVPHEVRSIQMIEKFFPLTEEENWAILMHNGLYGNFKYDIPGKETMLYLLISSADMWCSRIIEKEEDGEE